jgi:hypothetical protein
MYIAVALSKSESHNILASIPIKMVFRESKVAHLHTFFFAFQKFKELQNYS